MTRRAPMPPHRILHLITSLDRGGAQTMLTHVATRLDRARFEPVVVSLTGGGEMARTLAAAGVRVVPLDMRRGAPSLAGFSRFRALLRAERPALIQSWLYHADLLALLGAGAIPFVWNIRLSTISAERNAGRLRLLRWLLARASGRPAAIVVNSERGRREHEALGFHPRRWEIIPNGFDLERFRPDPGRRGAWRRTLGVGETEPLIGMVARVDGMKDHATFLAAAGIVAARHAGLRALLIGKGTETIAVPPHLAGVVRALGERDDLDEVLPALDLMVLASNGEGFPNAVGEAMACGVPCVASDVGDAATIIGDTGAVVPPRDPGALAAAVLALLARGNDGLAILGAAARARIAERYAIATVAQRYEQLYASLLEATARTVRR